MKIIEEFVLLKSYMGHQLMAWHMSGNIEFTEYETCFILRALSTTYIFNADLTTLSSLYDTL